jgi:ABC-type protease/lipase transport system fused ATPase/permease subunit
MFSAFLNLLALTGAIFMLQIYDRVLQSGSVPTLVVLSLLAAALFDFSPNQGSLQSSPPMHTAFTKSSVRRSRQALAAGARRAAWTCG